MMLQNGMDFISRLLSFPGIVMEMSNFSFLLVLIFAVGLLALTGKIRVRPLGNVLLVIYVSGMLVPPLLMFVLSQLSTRVSSP